MSLGVKPIWRARRAARGFSLIPRALVPASSRSFSRSVRSSSREDLPDGSLTGRIPRSLVDRLASLPVRQHGPRESVLVEPRIEYPHRLETRRSERRNHQGITAQLRLDRLRAAQHAPPPNWRLVLHNLAAWTPRYRHDDAELLLPPPAADLLLSDAPNNAWDIQSRTGVSMKMGQTDGDGLRSLFLSGNRSSIDRAVEDILQATKKVAGVLRGNPTTKRQDPTTSLTIRETRTQARPYILSTRADEIPRPSRWTKASLETYVLTLTTGRLPPSLASTLYPRGASHDEAVIKQLHHVFNDPAARPALSVPAFKTALAFMARKGHAFRPHARALFVRMEMLGLPMDTAVFNLLAESAVKARDLRSFSTTLALMARRGHRPDLGTWLLFLRLIKSEEVKRYILHAMDRTGLLGHPDAVPLVARELVAHDMDRAVQQGRDFPTFMADQDRLYGPGWLGRDAANKIAEVLGRHGRFDDCSCLVEAMVAAGAGSPDVVTLNTVLTHCKVQNNLHRAVDVLARFELVGVVPDPVSYHLLSELAWRHKLPHAAGLVWRYSCLVGKTSYRMRRRTGSLLRRTANSPLETLLLGQVMTDAEPGLQPAENAGDAMRHMMQWYEQRRRGWEPVVPLSGLLREALDRDARLLRELKEGVGVPTIEPVALPTRRRQRGGEISEWSEAEDVLG